ncbi:MAG: hypothetical protein ACRDST_01755 [Pseudonocardiaceae bacterium]
MTSAKPGGTESERPCADEVEAVMLAARVLVAIIAHMATGHSGHWSRTRRG